MRAVQKKVAVVTGATSGIGLETARGLAREGFALVLACRDKEKAAGLTADLIGQFGKAEVHVIPVDMASLQSVRDFAAAFSDQFEALHVLVNNAGVFCERPQRTADGFEMTMGVNYLAPFLLTRLLLPALRSTPGARVVNITSKAAFHGKLKPDEHVFSNHKHGFKAYAASKLAQLLFTIDLAEELRREGDSTAVNAAYPGRVATNIWKGGSLMMKIAAPLMMRNSISAEEGARPGLYLATSPAVNGVSGKLFSKEGFVDYNPKCLDETLRRKLMQLSCRAVGMEP